MRKARMATMRFNAIIYANRLKDAGLQSQIADIQAEELSNILNDDMATKKDIEILRLQIEAAKNDIIHKLAKVIVSSALIISLMIGVLGFLLKV